MPVVILEGVDGSGKSTFADKIAALVPHDYEVIREHKGPLTGPVWDEYVTPLMNIRDDQFLIADRWHVGEMIYGPLYRGKSEVTPAEERLIELLLARMGAVRIIMQPGLSTVRKRLGDRGEDFLLAENVKQVHDFYGKYAEKHDWDIVSKGSKQLAQAAVDVAIAHAWEA